MFTGLVEAVGVVRAASAAASGSAPRRLVISSALKPSEVALGDSVAIDGCCLTVVERGGDTLSFEAARETMARTTLAGLKPGDHVHLERALKLGQRLGGHWVTGHVDGVGYVRAREPQGSSLVLGIEAPAGVWPLLAAQGSVALGGVSLTINKVEAGLVWVGLIPHTCASTTLDKLQVGSPINVEADLVARYVARYLAVSAGAAGGTAAGASSAAPGGGGLTLAYLEEQGFA